MNTHNQQTFFLPDPCTDKSSVIRAETYNLAHTLLNRSDSGYVFVPIRNMQYLAVIDGHDIWFVDSQAYAVSHNEGGRLITISWHTDPAMERHALNENIPLRVVFYANNMGDTQLRLSGEFHSSMLLMDGRYRDQQIPDEGARIIHLKPE
jgi:hypothetical protein